MYWNTQAERTISKSMYSGSESYPKFMLALEMATKSCLKEPSQSQNSIPEGKVDKR